MLFWLDAPISAKKSLKVYATSTTFSETLIEFTQSGNSAWTVRIIFRLHESSFRNMYILFETPMHFKKNWRQKFFREFLFEQSTFFQVLTFLCVLLCSGDRLSNVHVKLVSLKNISLEFWWSTRVSYALTFLFHLEETGKTLWTCTKESLRTFFKILALFL